MRTRSRCSGSTNCWADRTRPPHRSTAPRNSLWAIVWFITSLVPSATLTTRKCRPGLGQSRLAQEAAGAVGLGPPQLFCKCCVDRVVHLRPVESDDEHPRALLATRVPSERQPSFGLCIAEQAYDYPVDPRVARRHGPTKTPLTFCRALDVARGPACWRARLLARSVERKRAGIASSLTWSNYAVANAPSWTTSLRIPHPAFRGSRSARGGEDARCAAGLAPGQPQRVAK